jgi:hypothetical protein
MTMKSFSIWKFKEIGQIDVGNVNKFKVRLRLFSKKHFRKNFIWMTKNLIFSRTEFYYFNSLIRPCHSKCQNFLVRIKNWIIFRWSFCFLACTTGVHVQKQKKRIQISISWMKAFRLSLLCDGRKYQKIAVQKKGTKRVYIEFFTFFTSSKR